jgi:hypothetical protein
MVSEASAPLSQLITHPRNVWPRENTHFVPWLARNLDALARCLELEHLEFVGREVPVGELRPSHNDRSEVCALRMDLVACDERGRVVVIEAQIGPADHAHMGQLITYGKAACAGVVVWVVAEIESSFVLEQLEALAELNEVFAGRREFHVVEVTAETDPAPLSTPDGPLIPRLRRIDLATGAMGPTVSVRTPPEGNAGGVTQATGALTAD